MLRDHAVLLLISEFIGKCKDLPIRNHPIPIEKQEKRSELDH